MLAGYYGHTITPKELNDLFNQKGIYSQGDLLTDDALTKVFPDIAYQESYDYAKVPANLNQLKALAADDATTIILELDFDHDLSDGIQRHFVCVHSYDGTTLQIYDPWWGTDADFSLHYGDDPATTILKFVVYHGTPVAPPVSVDSATFTKLVHNSTQYDAVCAYFNLPQQPDGTDADFGEVKNKLDALTKNITDLGNEVQQGKDSIATLSTELANLNETDSTAIQNGLEAEKQRDSLATQLDVIAQALGLPTSATNSEITSAITALKKQAATPAPPVAKPKPGTVLTFSGWLSLGWQLLTRH